MKTACIHQYIERSTSKVRTEKLYADRIIRFLFSTKREAPTVLFNALTSGRMSSLMGFLNFEVLSMIKISPVWKFCQDAGIDLSECLDPSESLDTPGKLFERKIRYWDVRPMPVEPHAIVSPADARMIVGSFGNVSQLFIKEKFFRYEELIGDDKIEWVETFRHGDYAIFRLTPDKYHYNHVPVSGIVRDIYEIPGAYHPCNPGAVISVMRPYSKNKRVITVLDTDVPGGTGIGYVAMIEIVALMIGGIKQCYSDDRYDDPKPVTIGMFLRAGQPKSLYRPGSSTDVVIFQKDHIEFDPDILANRVRTDVMSRFTEGLGHPVVETEVPVRSHIARRSKRHG